MVSSGAFYTLSKGIVMGDEDRTTFDFNTPFSDDELLILLKRNPRMNMMCDWMVGQALKDGLEHPNLNELEQINFMAKIHRAMMFARLHGSSLILFLNDNPDLKQDQPLDGTKQFWDFEVYHKLALGNGWTVESVDEKGTPTQFKIVISTEKMKETRTLLVAASRCMVFKNPKKEERWDGSPSSDLIAHWAQLEELLLKCIGKFALDKANNFMHFENVPNSNAAAEIEAAYDQIPLKILITGSGITATPKSHDVKGNASDFEVISNILKKYMACAMNVSQSMMDGAAEGTLSTASTNASISYATIKEIQTHFKPFIEELLGRLGFSPDVNWKEPNPLGDNNVRSTSQPGTSERATSSSPDE